jgi:hypothetical protein
MFKIILSKSKGLTYSPIKYGKTSTRLVPREIKSVKII